MITVVVVIHLLVAMSMIGLILLQKSEGNAAGGGFAANSNITSMMQPRARANPLSRATVFMGILFFVTSIGLALMSKHSAPAPSLFTAPESTTLTGPQPKVTDIDEPSTTTPSSTAPAVPGSAAPAAATPAPAAPPAGAPAVPNN